MVRCDHGVHYAKALHIRDPKMLVSISNSACSLTFLDRDRGFLTGFIRVL